MIVGRGPNVRDDIRQFDPRGRGAERPAVDQHVLLLMTDIEGHQKTVAESLPVHTHANLHRSTR